MPRSRNYTAGDVWVNATRDIKFSQTDLVFNERFDIINRAVDAVVSTFFDLYSNSYMTPQAISSSSSTCKYLSAGTASWIAETGLLYGATMTGAFASTDVGKMIVFRIGTSGYVGYINEFVSTTAVYVRGRDLPLVDGSGTIVDVIVVPTVISGKAFNIDTLPIMRAGQQIKLELESTATKNIKFATSSTLAMFNASAEQNLDMIMWALSGEQILLDWGDNLANPGTLILRYPALPARVVRDDSKIDVPDGAGIEIVTMKITSIVGKRMKIQLADPTPAMSAMISLLYQTFGQQASAEQIKEKIQALK
jgi:hypothetical protein